MEGYYKNMEISKAYLLTKDFFNGVISEIFAKNIRERVINYPNAEENEEYFYVIRRILELVSVISPLFPFTACHISKRADLKWPSILNPDFYERIPTHNEMIKLRTDLINKLRLNRLEHQ
jgi:isoleucyl-tRNA synthetase